MYELPLATGGVLEIEIDGRAKEIGITLTVRRETLESVFAASTSRVSPFTPGETCTSTRAVLGDVKMGRRLKFGSFEAFIKFCAAVANITSVRRA